MITTPTLSGNAPRSGYVRHRLVCKQHLQDLMNKQKLDKTERFLDGRSRIAKLAPAVNIQYWRPVKWTRGGYAINMHTAFETRTASGE